MPDLIRYPQHTEITGFQLPDRVQDRLRRNDDLKEFQTLYETINIMLEDVMDHLSSTLAIIQ